MSSSQRLESWAKALGVVVALVGVAVSIHQFNQTYEMDAKRPFLEKQMELCLEASTVTATIASKPDADPTRQQAVDRFWVLYYGPLSVVEGNLVESHMVCFGRKLQGEGAQGCDDISLSSRSHRLAKSCRDLIATNWGVSKEMLVGADQD
ncbi:hypothetical protein [Jiella avicenniae]|uniref:Uncharacterized protein n=1 Tax=Jiella avicenniae TaxID=2907202 RepID=A0A9X1P3J3_9HYPH|nr:hypothetical protein [Jiella avicenniae]MCE7030765.1 hypothetical protein [Jiella avicenniae]